MDKYQAQNSHTFELITGAWNQSNDDNSSPNTQFGSQKQYFPQIILFNLHSPMSMSTIKKQK